MHQFHCQSINGNIVPLQQNKIDLLQKLLKSYEDLNMKFKLTIEVVDKNLNEQQIGLYKAFIIKSSNHFGNTYKEMEEILFRFFPIDINSNKRKPVDKWTSQELTSFIDNASALLAEHGFVFG